MFIAAHQWAPSPESDPQAPSGPLLGPLAAPTAHADLYARLNQACPSEEAREAAAAFLRAELAVAAQEPGDLPSTPDDLPAWMNAEAQRVTAQYGAYLEERKAGAPRRYFFNRAHALYFLRCVAPTKLVDGAWLYGLLEHWRNPRFAELIRTCIEEQGDGDPAKNHALLYRQLLAHHGIDPVDGLDDALYRQGAIQLALGWNAKDFLPEVIGFNLGYEQLPLHLLITAYEFNELGLDPYYFTLHITVDNMDTGHARRACQSVLDTLPQLGGAEDFWRRVREGAKLGCAGLGTVDVIQGFDIDAEVVRILRHKSAAGQGVHSDYCRVAGRSVNDWLARPEDMPQFLAALEGAGWVRRGEPAENSRFWGLLQGERAEMFGVFSAYELQVLHDWLRGDASADGQAYTEHAPSGSKRRPTFRAAARRSPALPARTTDEGDELLDPDLQSLQDQLATLDEAAQMKLLVHAMSPAQHWTPAGLMATRTFNARWV